MTFPFADLTFSFASICLDGSLTPSKTNHLFLVLVRLRRALLPLLLVAALAETGILKERAVFYSLSLCWLTCFHVFFFFPQFTFPFTVPQGAACAWVHIKKEDSPPVLCFHLCRMSSSWIPAGLRCYCLSPHVGTRAVFPWRIFLLNKAKICIVLCVCFLPISDKRCYYDDTGGKSVFFFFGLGVLP